MTFTEALKHGQVHCLWAEEEVCCGEGRQDDGTQVRLRTWHLQSTVGRGCPGRGPQLSCRRALGQRSSEERLLGNQVLLVGSKAQGGDVCVQLDPSNQKPAEGNAAVVQTSSLPEGASETRTYKMALSRRFLPNPKSAENPSVEKQKARGPVVRGV